MHNSNPHTWLAIRRFIEAFPNDKWSEWKRIASGIVTALEKLGLVDDFRIGQSMDHIIFSTVNYHGLVNAEPRVTLEINPEAKTVRVAYSTANIWFNPSLREEVFPEADATGGILQFLRRLWLGTKPNKPLPRALRAE